MFVFLTSDGYCFNWNCIPVLVRYWSKFDEWSILFWGSEDGKRPLFVVAGGEHTVALFDQVPGNQSIVQSYLHLKAGPKWIFSCTCWLHDSVLFLGHFMTNMASTLTVMANYSLQEGMAMELHLEIDLSHLLCCHQWIWSRWSLCFCFLLWKALILMTCWKYYSFCKWCKTFDYWNFDN